MIRCAAVKDDASGICFKDEMNSSAIIALILAIVCASVVMISFGIDE